MSRPSRIQQIYGYAVCLVAIVAVLISLPNLFEAALARRDPIQAGAQRRPDEASLSSFEAYRATYAGRPAPPGVVQQGSAIAADTPSTAELRQRFEVLRADRISRVRFETDQRLAVHALVLLIGVVLFATHWRWLNRIGGEVGEERS